MLDIINPILDSVELLVNESVNKLKFDKTIKATVTSCVDSEKRKYKCQYQNAIIYAYAAEGSNYSSGNLVYILVPENDMANELTIIGSANKDLLEKGSLYQTYYDIVGDNFIKLKNEANKTFELCSYDTDPSEIILYQEGSDTNYYDIDNQSALYYLQDSNSLLISGSFLTELPAEHQYGGNYGVKVTAQFKNAGGAEPILREYILDIDQMEGNPYKFVCFTPQESLFDINKDYFEKITKITFFKEGFSEDSEEHPADIFLEDLSINAVKVLENENTEGYCLSLSTPQGTIFTNTTEVKSLVANLRYNGEYLDSLDDSFIYWYIEDARVKNDSDGYESHGGRGWRCLNEFEFSNEDQNIRIWKQGPRILEVSDVLFENKYKCVVIYGGNVYEKTVSFKNINNGDISVSIASSNGTIFYFDQGSTTLTCTATPANQEYEYYWGYETVDGIFNPLEDIYTNECNVIISDIYLNRKYKCSVYREDDYIGTAEITIVNSFVKKEEGSADIYSLIIKNGNKMFLYDENGVSPASMSAATPIAIISLDYELYKNGQLINQQDCTQTWNWPTENTMLIPPEDIHAAIQPYKIEESFNYDKMNNEVELVVIYDGETVRARTSFNFAKEGDSGTNGTGIMCKIVPNVGDGVTAPANVIVRKSSNGEFHWNYTYQSQNQLKVIVYKDNEQLESNYYTLKWSMLGHKYDTATASTSFFTIDDNGRLTPTSNWDYTQKDIVNIVRCEIIFEDGFNVFATLPIITVVSDTDIDFKGGCKYVTYLSDGTNPMYDNNAVFEMPTGLSDYSWSVVGGFYEYENGFIWKDKSLITIEDIENNENKKKISVSNIYDGMILNNALMCAGTGYTIHIPVHFMFNRYGNANINAWDGNGVEINDEGGFILATQVGAGHKNEDNSFSGVVIGDVQQYEGNKETGLFAYGEGVRTVFIDAETGEASFGTQGNAIQITPAKTEIHFENENGNITSGDHNSFESNSEGFYLGKDGLSIGESFSVDETGKFKATEGEISGNVVIDGTTITNEIVSEDYEEGPVNPTTGAKFSLVGTRIGLAEEGQIEMPGFYSDKDVTVIREKGYIGESQIVALDGGTIAAEHSHHAWKLRSAPTVGSGGDRYYVSMTKHRNFIVSNSADNPHDGDNDTTSACNVGMSSHPWNRGYFNRLYSDNVPLGSEYFQLTLTGLGWETKTKKDAEGNDVEYYIQVKNVIGIIAENESDTTKVKQFLQVAPTASSQDKYYNYGIIASKQEKNKLTFSCIKKPSLTDDIVVYVVAQNVRPMQVELDSPAEIGLNYDIKTSSVLINWLDPYDEMFASWCGTRVIRKKDAPPANENDYDAIVVDTTERNQYATTPYRDIVREEGIYYYAVLPRRSEYDDSGKIVPGPYTFTSGCIDSITVELATIEPSVLNEAIVSNSNVTINMTLQESIYEDMGYKYRKLVYKEGSEPMNIEDGFIKEIEVGLIGEQSVTILDLEGNTDYYFKLFEEDEGNRQAISNTIVAHTETPLIKTTLDSVTTTAITATVTATFANNYNITERKIVYKENSRPESIDDGTAVNVDLTAVGSKAIKITGLKQNTKYNFRIFEINASGHEFMTSTIIKSTQELLPLGLLNYNGVGVDNRLLISNSRGDSQDSYKWQYYNNNEYLGSIETYSYNNRIIQFTTQFTRGEYTKICFDVEIPWGRDNSSSWCELTPISQSSWRNFWNYFNSSYKCLMFCHGDTTNKNAIGSTPWYNMPRSIVKFDISNIGENTKWYLTFFDHDVWTKIYSIWLE